MARAALPAVIEELRIQGLGVIDDAVLELAPGLTVVTGETGAGKTMVVTGLGLLLGARADSGAVRTAAGQALVEGRVRVATDSPAGRRAAEAGAQLDEDGSLLLARSVSPEGRSKAWVGGRSAPVGLLTELAEDLVAVHGQSDQQRLLQPTRQRLAVDRYAGDAVGGPLAAYRTAYQRLDAVRRELDELTARRREREQESGLLRDGLETIEAVGPRPDEDAALAVEAERLAHADALRLAGEAAHAALVGTDTAEDPDALGLVVGARRALEQAVDFDPALAPLAERLGEVAALVADVAADLASYTASVDADPARLAAVEDRRSALGSLTRRFGGTVDDVLAWSANASQRLLELDGTDDRIGALQAETDQLAGEVERLGGQLTTARTAAGVRLGAAVTAELVDLAMPHAVVSVAVTVADRPGPHGYDEVELLLQPHAGAPARPLARGASGGELSRVMLAVEVVFAGADPVPTFVFDEVDAGVGGKAAVEVGRRLARLARTAQVLVVTHLPQVAAFADRHLVVEKSSDGAVVRSGVVALDDAGRAAELTRMLAGLEGSESGRVHAQELLQAAAAAKKERGAARKR